MLKPSKSVLTFGAGALALGVLMLAAPRAAHAIAATLVQVTNTAANPAIAQSPNTQAAQLVTLELSGADIPGTVFRYFFPITAIGLGGQFSVPANQSLVVTDIDLNPLCTSAPAFALSTPTLQSNLSFAYLAGPAGISTHVGYHSGLVFPPGSTPGGALFGCTSANVIVHGYLTSN